MRVYLLVHDDRSYDMGDSYLRGVYATREAATEALVTRAPSGRPSTAWSAHNVACCGVHEEDVLGQAVVDVQEDEPILTPDEARANSLVHDSFIDTIARQDARPNPYRAKLR